MTPRKIKTTEVNRDDYIIYLKKANDFYEIMQKAKNAELWAAVGLNAVHCAISCCDAILAYHLAIRSISDDHIDAAELLMRVPQAEKSGEANAYKRIIAKKNLIAYDCREFRRPEATDIFKLTERFYSWAKSILPK